MLRSPHITIPLAIALTACSPIGTPERSAGGADAASALRAEPGELRFDVSVFLGGTEVLGFDVFNDSDEPQSVIGYRELRGDEAFHNRSDLRRTSVLEPGEVLHIDVGFHPTIDRDHIGYVDVGESLAVPITGIARAPRLSLVDPQIQSAATWCSVESVFVLSNLGREELEIHNIDEGFAGDFRLPDGFPDRVPPGGQIDVPIQFHPTAQGEHAALLHVDTNDPERPRATIGLRGLAYTNEPVVEHFHYDSGRGGAVLLLLDPVGAAGADYADRALDGLESLLPMLAGRDIAYRAAAASPSTVCPVDAVPFVGPDMALNDAVAVLRNTLTDSESPGNYADRLLGLAYEVVRRTDEPGCFAGLLPLDQPLHIVVVSDQNDQTPGGWAAALADIEDSVSGEVAVSAIVPDVSCGNEPSAYLDAVAATGGVLASMCESDWSAHWDAIAQRTAELERGPTSWRLMEVPEPSSVMVTVDGERVYDWVLDESEGIVEFTRPPNDGADVQITYARATTCW